MEEKYKYKILEIEMNQMKENEGSLIRKNTALIEVLKTINKVKEINYSKELKQISLICKNLQIETQKLNTRLKMIIESSIK